jgi:hypothetical protein
MKLCQRLAIGKRYISHGASTHCAPERHLKPPVNCELPVDLKFDFDSQNNAIYSTINTSFPR